MLSILRAWLLADYAAPYCRSLATTRIFRRCYWVDAIGLSQKAATLSARGQNDNQGEVVQTKGRKKSHVAETPVVLQPLASLAQELIHSTPPITLHGLLFAAGSSRKLSPKHAALENLPLPPFDASRVLPYSWREVATPVLTELGQSPAIFLLNPLGPLLYSNDDLAPLYRRTVPTELLLLLPHRQVEAHLRSAARVPAQAAILTSLLHSDRWKTLALKEEQMTESIESFQSLLVASMQRHFTLPVQALTLPVLLRPAFLQTLPYTLLFATRRQDSLLCMNDAVCLYQRRLHAQSYRGLLNEEWFAAHQRERFHAACQETEQRIQTLGRAQRIRRWPELRQQLLLANFGTLTTQDYDQLIQQLLARRAIRCEWKRGSLREMGDEERIPGNDDTLFWN